MIQCPNCNYQEMEGALFCSECGAQLVAQGSVTTHSIGRASGGLESPQPAPTVVIPAVSEAAEETMVSLYLVESGKTFNLVGKSDFTIGRATNGQPILPDIDLSDYDAYRQGVSRLHAGLRILNKRLMITDLGSSNGTRVNGQKITPHLEYPLTHGDIIALGKFKIQVLIRGQ